jgi:hypothetical protein
MSSVVLTLPAEAVERIAERAAELVLTKLDASPSPWLTRKEAAAYLGVPVSRLEKDRRVPLHRWEGRVLYNREELDAFVRSLDNARP